MEKTLNEYDRVVLRIGGLQFVIPALVVVSLSFQPLVEQGELLYFTLLVPRPNFPVAPYRVNFVQTDRVFYGVGSKDRLRYRLYEHAIKPGKLLEERTVVYLSRMRSLPHQYTDRQLPGVRN